MILCSQDLVCSWKPELIYTPGKPVLLIALLRRHLPLLFPATTKSAQAYALAVPFAQGVEIPPDSEVAWLSACLCGVDGWLRIGIQLRAD